MGLAAMSAALLPVTGLAAGSSEIPSPLDQVVTAAATADRSIARVAVTLVPGQVFGVRQPPVEGTGLFDFSSSRGRVQLRESSGTETLLFAPQALYVREPPSRGPSALPAGKSWIAVGLTEAPAPGSSIPQFVDQAEAVNPGLVLAEVALGAVTATALSDGAPARTATAYVVTVDLRRALSGAPGAVTPAFARAVGDQIGSVARGPGETARVRIRLWVGATGRVARLQFSPPGSGVGRIEVTFTRSASARSLAVSPPPAAQTVDIASITPGGEQESGLGDVA
jgi:hypothetical protein